MHVKDNEVKVNGYMENGDDCLNGYHELTEVDFYPPEDTRVYASGIDDIEDGDSFCEYAECFWDTYGYEIYDESDLNCI